MELETGYTRITWVGRGKKDMTITAKFASTCPACGQSIAVGQSIEWERGSKARHTDCHAAPSASDGRKPDRMPDTKPDESARVYARRTYKSKDYYQLARTKDDAKVLLAARNGAFQFWAAAAQTTLVKEYGREDYRSRRVEYPTLGGLVRLAEKYRREKAAGNEPCDKCGSFHSAADRGCNMCGCTRCDGAHGGLCEDD